MNGPPDPAPVLVDDTAAAVRARARDLIPGYTPEWTDLRREDAGVALLRLFGDLAEPVLERVNRLPDKLLAEHLRIAGVRPRPPGAASLVLQLEVSGSAPAPVPVAAGFPLGAPPATGDGDRVVVETLRDVVVSPVRIAAVARQVQRRLTVVDTAAGRFLPFGDRPEPGSALWLGLDGPYSPAPLLSLAVETASEAGRPPAVARGELTARASAPPVLVWQVRAAGRLEQVEVQLDETAGLRQDGVVELRVPAGWEPERPPGLDAPTALRWLRVQLVHGGYDVRPALAALRPHCVRATAARTVRDEVAEPVGGPGPGARLRLGRTPVLPGSVVLEIDDVPAEDVFGVRGPGAVRTLSGWEEVDSLAGAAPGRRVFELDPATGVLTFGDGTHGAAVPPGFRNVRATSYRVGGGPEGAIEAGVRLTPILSVPFVTGATSVGRASGGTAAESREATLARGPLEIRSGGRAVTVADYALLARRTPGADVARAHAVTGLHPDVPGRPVPGTVGVLVVPARREPGAQPTPDAQTLTAVAAHLADGDDRVAPAGVRVVAGAPRYQRVRVESRLVVRDGADAGATVREALAALDGYLDPVTGGPDGSGWPFGGRLRHDDVAALLLRAPGVRAVPSLRLVVDGRRLPACTDHVTAAHALLWPVAHELVPVSGGAR